MATRSRSSRARMATAPGWERNSRCTTPAEPRSTCSLTRSNTAPWCTVRLWDTGRSPGWSQMGAGSVMGHRFDLEQPRLALPVQGGTGQSDEQRVTAGGAGLEFRVGLGGDVVRVLLAVQFHEPHQGGVRGPAADPQPGPGQLVAVGVVHLVPVPVPFPDPLAAIDLRDDRVRFQDGLV